VGVPQSMLPDAIESTATVGNILPELARSLGLNDVVKVVAGGADNSCAAIGNGIVTEGQAVVSVGTSGTVVAFLNDINAKVTGDVHLFNYSYPGGIYAMSVMLSAGEALNWLRRSLMPELSFEDMNALAEQSPAGANRLVFLPYIFGERCPYSDADARGVFFGLSGTTDKADMVRAVMEGVAFGFKDLFGLVTEFVPLNEVYITGGGAKSDIWGRIIADVLGVRLSVLNIEEGPAFGAALIAAVGSGVFANFEEAKGKALSVVKTYEPDKNNNYDKLYGVYKSLYTANKKIFGELAGA